MKALLAWIDDRTGLWTTWCQWKDRSLPRSASVRGIWSSTILFAFVVQVITGLALWMYYSPSAQSAWESVYYLQYQVAGGWLLRAVHHFAAQVMVAMIGLYLLWMIFTGGYRAPREFVFWVALLMGMIGLGLLLTGDLLSWDQNGFWATQVRTKFLTLLPVIGDPLFKLAAGGPAFGHHTLTRFFALHAGVFSGLLLVLMCIHQWLLYRAEKAELATAKETILFWPCQAVRNTAGWIVMLLVVGLLIGQHSLSAPKHASESAAEAYGIGLGAPADPADAYAAARPEWAFLGLYQLTHSFPGDAIPGLGVSWKAVPIFVLPTILVVFFFAIPVVGRKGVGHGFNVVVTAGLLVWILWLSYLSIEHDLANAEHQTALADGRAAAVRARELAQAPAGIPVTGALTLLRDDAKTQGPKLFKQHCASCHSFTDAEGKGIAAEKPTAPNLHDFASVAWLTGFLDREQIAGPNYFGNTAFKDGKMVGFVKGGLKELLDDEELKKSYPQMIEALAAQSKPDAQAPSDETSLLFEDFTCTDCHKFHDKGAAGNAPDLTGYGSRDWLIGIVSDPTHKRFYGANNDRMPAYAKDAAKPEDNVLTKQQVEMIADWLRGQWYEPEVASK
jgi:ubiquinol-cytochrome c reductase cytochrome b subunit